MGIDDAFKRIQKNYLNELPEIFDEVEEQILNFEKDAQDENSFREFQGKLHSMKGTAGSLEINFLTTACHNLEDYLASNEKVPYNTLSQTCLNVIDLMKNYSKNFDSIGPEEITEYKEKLKKIILGTPKEDNSKPAPPKLHILINENDVFMKNLLKRILGEFPTEIAFARNGYEALGRILDEDFDGVFTSYESELINGQNLAKMIRINNEIKPNLKLYLITSHDRLKNLKEFNQVFLKNAELEKHIHEEINKTKKS